MEKRMISNGKVTMSDAEYVAIMEHDTKQVTRIIEQRARIAELEALVRDAAAFIDTCNVPDSDWWASALVWFERAGDLAQRATPQRRNGAWVA